MKLLNKKKEKIQISKANLDIERTLKNLYISPDYFVHINRYYYILKKVRNFLKHKKTIKILDVGCGKNAYLAICLFHNYLCSDCKVYYTGVDVLSQSLKKLTKYWKTKNSNRFFPKFIEMNYIENFIPGEKFDFIVCFEVIEHFDKKYIHNFLNNIKQNMNQNTILFLSTPNFNDKKAKHHIYEYKFEELKEILEKHFKIEKVVGTFINLKDIPEPTSKEFLEWSDLFVKIVYAAKYPNLARNCLWELKLKN